MCLYIILERCRVRMTVSRVTVGKGTPGGTEIRAGHDREIVTDVYGS